MGTNTINQLKIGSMTRVMSNLVLADYNHVPVKKDAILLFPQNRCDGEKFKPSQIPLRRSYVKEAPVKPSVIPKKFMTKPPFKTQARNVQRIQVLNTLQDFCTEKRPITTSLATSRPIPTLGQIYRRTEDTNRVTDWLLERDNSYLHAPVNAIVAEQDHISEISTAGDATHVEGNTGYCSMSLGPQVPKYMDSKHANVIPIVKQSEKKHYLAISEKRSSAQSISSNDGNSTGMLLSEQQTVLLAEKPQRSDETLLAVKVSRHKTETVSQNSQPGYTSSSSIAGTDLEYRAYSSRGTLENVDGNSMAGDDTHQWSSTGTKSLNSFCCDIGEDQVDLMHQTDELKTYRHYSNCCMLRRERCKRLHGRSFIGKHSNYKERLITTSSNKFKVRMMYAHPELFLEDVNVQTTSAMCTDTGMGTVNHENRSAGIATSLKWASPHVHFMDAGTKDFLHGKNEELIKSLQYSDLIYLEQEQPYTNNMIACNPAETQPFIRPAVKTSKGVVTIQNNPKKVSVGLSGPKIMSISSAIMTSPSVDTIRGDAECRLKCCLSPEPIKAYRSAAIVCSKVPSICKTEAGTSTTELNAGVIKSDTDHKSSDGGVYRTSENTEIKMNQLRYQILILTGAEPIKAYRSAAIVCSKVPSICKTEAGTSTTELNADQITTILRQRSKSSKTRTEKKGSRKASQFTLYSSHKASSSETSPFAKTGKKPDIPVAAMTCITCLKPQELMSKLITQERTRSLLLKPTPFSAILHASEIQMCGEKKSKNVYTSRSQLASPAPCQCGSCLPHASVLQNAIARRSHRAVAVSTTEHGPSLLTREQNTERPEEYLSRAATSLCHAQYDRKTLLFGKTHFEPSFLIVVSAKKPGPQSVTFSTAAASEPVQLTLPVVTSMKKSQPAISKSTEGGSALHRVTRSANTKLMGDVFLPDCIELLVCDPLAEDSTQTFAGNYPPIIWFSRNQPGVRPVAKHLATSDEDVNNQEPVNDSETQAEPQKFKEACTMKPSGRNEFACQTQVRRVPNIRQIRAMSCCTLNHAFSVTDICRGRENDLRTVYFLLSAIEGRIRRMKRYM
ncbi:hypothetical protein MSG28_007284 [Choristoneura fumiferana]|uniref:Uncharacterized protein n=2 Tax=Choristoneura fumiferana TaxID=7141 RepID=A0ACC0JW94_CHOFU|nr:hypothetical protein MSG28_007284 [Choristoneura fumiferana]